MGAEGMRDEGKPAIGIALDQAPQPCAEEQHREPPEDGKHEGERTEVAISEGLDDDLVAFICNERLQAILPLAERANAVHCDDDALGRNTHRQFLNIHANFGLSTPCKQHPFAPVLAGPVL
ncbi:hypothetical protein ELH48_36360 (plasmid) [Rhizobium ruizarguesonis]|nr:hypothetical protein ELH48_36360 [Rhizobium ruizarguesonis]